MNGQQKDSYEFCGYYLTPSEHVLIKDGSQVMLSPKAFEILVLFVENPGELITKQDIMQSVWPESFVEESNIQVHISAIRKTLGLPALIETVPKKGYRFTGQVVKVDKTLSPGGEAPLSEESAATDNTEQSRDAEASSEAAELSRSRPRRFILAVGTVALLALAVLGFSERSRISAMLRRPARFDFSQMNARRVTDNGASFDAALSPDGKFLVYQTLDKGKFSVWLMEPDTGSHVEIVPPSDQRRTGFVFSTGGDDLYFISSDRQAGSTSNLYRMPKLGGDPIKVLTQLDSAVTFSPDGSEFAFIRNDKSNGTSSVMISNADGSSVRELASRKTPDLFPTGKRPSWSPDGRSIAVIGRNADEKFLRVLLINVADGTERPISEENWSAVQDVSWLADSASLLVTAQDDINFGPLQLWKVAADGGRAEKISREVQSYVGLSLDQADQKLVSTRNDAFGNIWVQQGSDFATQKEILSNKGVPRIDLSWTPDGRIVYISDSDGHTNIHVMTADGAGQMQLTNDNFAKRSPVVSPDGKFIVFVSSQLGPDQLWRMNPDGSHQQQLSNTQIFLSPLFSPDGKWIVFLTHKDDKSSIWRVSVDGGDPELLKADLTYVPRVSPDLKEIAYVDKPGDSQEMTLKLINFTDNSVRGSFKLPAGTYANSVEWAPDGKALLYRSPTGYLINYWQQPIAGGEPRQITDFATDFPASCIWSCDVSKLACLRAALVRDVVMFSASGH